MPISFLSQVCNRHGDFNPTVGVSSNSCAVLDDLPPDKALRAQMLKSRFADTIKKANSFLNGGFTTDLKKKERRVGVQQGKKSKIESENRIKLEKKREAARMYLKEMEKSVIVEDNFKVMKELNILLGHNGGDSRKLMKVIGLHLKKDEVEEGAEE